MKSRLKELLLASDTSTFYGDDRLGQLIKDSYLWAAGLYEWPELEKGRKTTSNGEENYDYPAGFKSDTLREYIRVDGLPYKKKSWPDYLEYKRLNPNSTKRIFADYARQYFISPIPPSGKVICVWGIEQPTPLVNNTDRTIFSGHDVSGNHAIVRKAFSDGIRRVDSKLADTEEKAAVVQLTVIWDKVKKRNQYSQPISKPMFNTPNFFGSQIGGVITSYEEED